MHRWAAVAAMALVPCASPARGQETPPVDQRSRAGCWKGDTWGHDRRGICVADGCRAEFWVE